MRLLRLFFIGIASLFLLTACVPKVHTTLPSVEGTITDLNSHKPLEGVRIDRSIQSDRNGHFVLAEKSELGIGTPMGGIWHISRNFKVEQEGYIPLACNCDVLNSNGGCTEVHIPLIKISEQKHYDSIPFKGISCIPYRQQEPSKNTPTP